MMYRQPENIRLGIVGLGYVGLPLALAFGRHFFTLGYDTHAGRIEQLQLGIDETGETAAETIRQHPANRFTAHAADLADCNVFILAIPTPITPDRRPDFSLLNDAVATVAALLKPGDLVIVESTVYPGATEEKLVPILENISGLTFNRDFFAGYSPERINPGDQVHKLENIVKITSGSTPEAAAFVDALYRKIIAAGTHPASSIRVAEAAKAIENAQRDINIAFVNELAVIFSRIGLDTHEVLEAAGTKWNFLPFKPGLVGGHCIGVDPYYLAHKALEAGHHPEIILAGRKINDGMPGFVALQVKNLLEQREITVTGAKVLVLGIAFKENCADVRNSGSAVLVSALEALGMAVSVYDPVVSAAAVASHYGFSPVSYPMPNYYQAIVLAVGHHVFGSLNLEQFKAGQAIVYDVRNFFDRRQTDGRL